MEQRETGKMRGDGRRKRERERENTSELRYSRNTGSLNPGKEP